MSNIDGEIIARIKKALELLEKNIEKEAIIFIDSKGAHFFNDFAQELISGARISKKDFIEWLKIGSSHLQNLRYGDIGIQLIGLPGKELIAFLRHERGKNSGRNPKLTLKEREVLRHLAKGLSNKKIAELMKVSPGTVNGHLDSIFSKLDCPNRLTACLTALKNGLFLPESEDPPPDKT